MILDVYKRPFNFLLPSKTEYYRNYLGMTLSLITILLLIAYGTFKFKALILFTDYNLFEIVQDSFYNDQDEFTTNDGFHVAAGIVDFNAQYVEDPEIGTLKIIMKSWNYEDKESNGKALFREVKTRPCRQNDFNDVDGNNKESRFYATDIHSDRSLQLYWKTLKCIDDNEFLSINGNY